MLYRNQLVAVQCKSIDWFLYDLPWTNKVDTRNTNFIFWVSISQYLIKIFKLITILIYREHTGEKNYHVNDTIMVISFLCVFMTRDFVSFFAYLHNGVFLLYCNHTFLNQLASKNIVYQWISASKRYNIFMKTCIKLNCCLHINMWNL